MLIKTSFIKSVSNIKEDIYPSSGDSNYCADLLEAREIWSEEEKDRIIPVQREWLKNYFDNKRFQKHNYYLIAYEIFDKPVTKTQEYLSLWEGLTYKQNNKNDFLNHNKIAFDYNDKKIFFGIAQIKHDNKLLLDYLTIYSNSVIVTSQYDILLKFDIEEVAKSCIRTKESLNDSIAGYLDVSRVCDLFCKSEEAIIRYLEFEYESLLVVYSDAKFCTQIKENHIVYKKSKEAQDETTDFIGGLYALLLDDMNDYIDAMNGRIIYAEKEDVLSLIDKFTSSLPDNQKKEFIDITKKVTSNTLIKLLTYLDGFEGISSDELNFGLYINDKKVNGKLLSSFFNHYKDL